MKPAECMHLIRLKAGYFRNFVSLDLEPVAQFNLIYGMNGSGKTSILEAIYFLSVGRSFRSHLTSPVICYTASHFTLFAVVAGCLSTTIGLEKTRHGKTRLKIGHDSSPSLADLAKILPMQLINSGSYQLLNGGPKVRRRFLDWGVFHTKPKFFSVWKDFQRVLKQRNAALQRQAMLQIKGWSQAMVTAAQELVQLRQDYLQQLTALLKNLLVKLLHLKDFSMDYYPGWDVTIDFKAVLEQNLTRDLALGYTVYGPHRSDLILKVKGIPIPQVLSRGEQKILVYALQIAQGQLLKQLTGKNCIYLLDDLVAEIDIRHQVQLVGLLEQLQTQVFITAIEWQRFVDMNIIGETKTFYVESGQVSVI